MNLFLAHDRNSHSWLGYLDPRWKLAGLTFATTAVPFFHSPWATGLAFIASLVLGLIGRLPPRWLFGKILAVLPFVLTFAIWLPFVVAGQDSPWQLGSFPVSERGLELAGLFCLKTLTIVTLMLILFATASIDDLLKAAHALYVPGLIVYLFLLTYRYIFVLGSELSRLRIAIKVRGFRNRFALHSYRTIGHVAGTLLVRGSERAERVGQAMCCRGFKGEFHSLARFQTTPGDVAFFAALISAATLLVAWDRLGG